MLKIDSATLELILDICTLISSLINNRDRFLEEKSYQLLECAYTYLKADKIEKGLLRQAIQHIETAVSFMDNNPSIDRTNRISLYNTLCVYIAYMHRILGDSEDIVLFWVNKINTQVSPPEVLRTLNENCYNQKQNVYLESQREDSFSYYDTTEDPVYIAQTHYN